VKARLLIVTLAALSLLGTTIADAASRKPKQQKTHRVPAPAVVQGAVPHGPGAYQASPGFPANRPAWARATECYTDEGYGRFTPCSISRDSF
jgi:hypothetical protein